jgi:CspA family cold shock protein
MANGKVDFFNDTGGYGFIATDDSDDDVFFHMEDVGGEDLTEGTEIEFDIQQAPGAPARRTSFASNDWFTPSPRGDSTELGSHGTASR